VSCLIFDGTLCTAADTLVVTDDEAVAEVCEQAKIACIGYCPDESVYFPHVQQVWESFEGMERSCLEQFFNRFHHLPVIIARAGRILLRESLPEDFETLRRMGQEAGWHLDALETREQFLSYLKYAYSFYGYGYWTVEQVKTGEIVGWCGFSGWGLQKENPEDIYMKLDNQVVRTEQISLELGYLVDAAHRRKGLAYEMCCAALGYALETLGAGTVWVRIAPGNIASLKLAQKLGFRRAFPESHCEQAPLPVSLIS
jgi:RimJ/RimL family protein N-acetyltransferase